MSHHGGQKLPAHFVISKDPHRAKTPPESSILIKGLIAWQSWFGLLQKTGENSANVLQRKSFFKEKDHIIKFFFFPLLDSRSFTLSVSTREVPTQKVLV